ncbi:DUF58 domain-containing protein [Rubritalea tangerina]|uniref:DUF58 domain-containing protein n=1 Tax=Rubritalea tangerina TaxID=430798 RepID=UPI00361725FD
MLNQKELENKIRHIQVQSRMAVTEMLAGEYRSSFKGMGIEFEDVRNYQHGDDVRSIDWNVTARTGAPHVKTFMEERELSLYFLIDLSGSSDFGSGTATKRDTLTRIFALLAFAAAHNHDNVGLILFAGDVEEHLPARKGKNHVMRMIDLIMRHQTRTRGTSIHNALNYLNQVRRKRCVAFLFSDFLDSNFADALKDSAHRHDLSCVAVHDPRESQLPNSGMIELRDSESGKILTIDTQDPILRKKSRPTRPTTPIPTPHTLHEAMADLLTISTEEDYLLRIIQFLRERNHRSADA